MGLKYFPSDNINIAFMLREIKVNVFWGKWDSDSVMCIILK